MTEPELKILKLSKSVRNKTVEHGINTESEHVSLAPDSVFLQDYPLAEENCSRRLELSIEHEEELVGKALYFNSAMKGIKWYYETYRPEDYELNNT